MNNNEKIIEIIKNRRLDLNLSLSEVARRMGIPKSTLSRYESLQRQFPLDQVSTIASVLGLHPEDILGLSSQTITETHNSTILSEINKISSKLEEPRQQIVLDTANNQLVEQNNELKDAEARKRKILSLDSKPIDITKIPGYMPYEADKLGTAPILGDIAAGYNIMAEENFDGMIPVGPEYAGRDDIFWLNIRGQSMESLIHDGTLGLFEHSEDIHDGRIGAVMSENGDWITVKRIYHNYDENGYLLGLTLVPENEECDTIVINEYNPGRIIGRLLEVKQYF
ncbi:helix-turn-helix domain-containing protein [Lactococcus lactis]|uniref:helix-turn-helix domain-containing protein n=1 Tax=Lactococcus lactis TaxID=1358 RepID=UPI0021A62ECD|nr:LexA family transcriptional regulator [Lactococcus lactis]MCT2920642.1 helix-turn-helix domain-containing protein [Lactococcus lactis]